MLSKPFINPFLKNLKLQKTGLFQYQNLYFKPVYNFSNNKNSLNQQQQEENSKNLDLQQEKQINIQNDQNIQQQQQKQKDDREYIDNPLKEFEENNKYVYDAQKLKDINEVKLVDKIKKLEDEKKNENTWAFDGIRFPLALVLGSLIIYHTWQTIPYGVAYKHFSHSEEIPRNQQYHAIFFGNLSFQNTGQLMVYFPLMVGSMVLSAKFFKQRHLALLFFTNSLLTYGVTYVKEKNKKISPMITPKSHGSATALAFLFAQFGLKPDLMIMGMRSLPFFIIPATMLMYEVWEYQNGQINEVCREAHLASILYGAAFGLLFKRFCWAQPRKII